MSTNERIKRPSLDRTAPVRNWSTLLNAAPSGDAASAGEAGTNSRGTSGLGDAIARSVALGYQVVEEYVRQGEHAARRMSEGAYRTESVTADAGAPSAPAGKLGVPDVPDVPAVPDGGALDGWPVAAGPTAIGAQPAIASSSDTVTATASS